MGWALIFLAVNSPVNTISMFQTEELCEKVRVELTRKIPMKAAACIELKMKLDASK